MILVGLVKLPLINDAFVALNPPVIPPVTVGVDQLYKVPAGTIPFVLLTGLTVKVTPLQLTVVIAVISAVGLIVTVKVNGAPNPQFTILGVTIYVAVLAILVVLFNVPLITLTGTLCDKPPVKPTPVGTDQI